MTKETFRVTTVAAEQVKVAKYLYESTSLHKPETDRIEAINELKKLQKLNPSDIYLVKTS